VRAIAVDVGGTTVRPSEAKARMVSMPYLSLYRKYRPQTFDDILGQGHVSETLARAITEDRVAHAYLFTGPRGTGKTSMARILAKALNCERGPTPNPCGVCAACVAITEGSSLDVIEMDAASHSKVDETRDILAGVPLATAGGSRKVYVIDEVHMLSAGSFNALLKTLEEPPPHVIFILATTEAHKVLATIVSRTQRFDFRRATVDVLQPFLENIAKLEGMDVEPAALNVLARHAEGSFRDALSALDQLSSFGGSVSAEEVERLLGERTEDAFVEVFDAIASGDVGEVFAAVHTQVAQGADPRQLALGALEHARSLLLLRTSPDSEDLLDAAEDDRPTLLAQAQRFTPGELVRTTDLIAKSLIEMRNAPNHRLLLEIALVRAAAPDTDPSGTGLLGRIERLERRMGIDSSAEGVPAPAVQPVRPAPSQRAETVRPGGEERAEPPRTRPTAPARSQPVASDAAQETEAAASPAAGAPPAAAPAGVPAEVGLSAVKDSWPATLAEVKRRSIRVWGLLDRSRPLRFDGDRLIVEVQSDFHAGEMTSAANRETLAEALHAALGISPGLVFMQPNLSSEPAPVDTGRAADVATTTEATAEHDPVELVKRGLGAEVVEEKPTTQ
jgi:DNA polymerase-3 subunit gamma/tau